MPGVVATYKINERFPRLLGAAAFKVAEWTARDIKSAAARSMKSGGKSRRSKNYRTSKPGEPPRSHAGTIKKAVAVEKTDAGFIVGAAARGGSRALRVLEYGGAGTIRRAVYSPTYEKTLRSRPARPTNGRTRPNTARRYSIQTSDGKRATVSKYRRFYSRAAHDRAAAAPAFQEWARRAVRMDSASVDVKPRPYMFPALKRETAPARIEPRVTRAVRVVAGSSKQQRKKKG